MTTGILRIDRQKFRVIAEQDYKTLRAARVALEREAKLDARDLKIAQDRLKNPKRKLIPLSRLKADLGL